MADKLVLVTGANGYIASHVVQQLQQAGYRVRGTVRTLDNEEKNAPLKGLVPDAKHPLELVAANLTSDDGWNDAVKDCYAVIHMASPFPNVAEKKVKEEELVGPAKQGTIMVLKAAAEAGVQKFVLTSSFASVFADAAVSEADKKFTEEDWSNPDSATIDVYSKSKVVAEKAAWDLVKELPEDKKLSLSVINPTFVMGPPLMPCHRSATSVGFMIDILNHKLPGVARLMMPYCDVRDVARAHVQALNCEEAAGKRHIIITDCMWLKDVHTIVAKEFRPQGYRVATNVLPYFLVWISSFFMEGIRGYVLPRIGTSYSVDNSRMVNVLGITPITMEKSLVDMAYALIDLNMVAKAKKYKQVGSRAEVPAAAEPAPAEDSTKIAEEQQADELPAKEQPPAEETQQELEPEDKDKEHKEEDKKAEEVKSS
uniref:NADPH-dependent aldehyde reductase ARI1-like n=1 Tax=Hirondellea gigas TaxID=1518452 RepID=A0A2P2I3A9_9CRUS